MPSANAEYLYRTIQEAVIPTGGGERPVESDRFERNLQLVLDVVLKASKNQVKDFKKMSFLYADVKHASIEYHFSSENFFIGSVRCQLHLRFQVSPKDRDRVPYDISASKFRCSDD